jgi:hypothetical protein
MTRENLLQKIGSVAYEKYRADEDYHDLYAWYMKANPLWEQRRRGSEGKRAWQKKREPILKRMRLANRKLKAYMGLMELEGWKP